MSERTNGKQKKNGKAGGVKLQSRMSRKVLIPVICLVIIAMLSSVIGHWNLKSMYQASNEITRVYMTKTAQLNEISDKFKEMEILAYSMCVTKSTNDRASMLEQSAATKEEINGLLEQLDQMAVTEDEKSRVQNITAYYQGFTDAYQKVTDSIENGDVKFFVWAEQEEWGFQVVPVYCERDELYLGKAEFFSFESDNWVNSFFDGKK